MLTPLEEGQITVISEIIHQKADKVVMPVGESGNISAELFIVDGVAEFCGGEYAGVYCHGLGAR